MLENRLRELATQSTSGPFLSLYLDTQRGDAAQGDRIRVLIKNETQRIRENLGGNGHDQEIERGIRQIETYMQNDLHPETRGVAIFSCPTDDIFIPLQLPVAVRPELAIGSRPHLRQLAALKRQNPRMAVALVDAKFARLFELEFGQVLNEIDLADPDVPRRHDQGGWSQANMQRHVQDHIDRHHKEVADTLTKMFDKGRFEGILLAGQERNVANFRTYLPKRVDEKVIGSLRLDIRASVDEVVSACSDLMEERRAEVLRQQLADLEAAALGNGRGALGLRRVVDAVNQRKLQHLYLRDDVNARGWRCTRCGTLGEAIPVGCPVCGEAVLTVDLVEEFVSAAELEDARIDFVPPGTALDEWQGVGATLRF